MRISDWSSDVCSSDLLACRIDGKREDYVGVVERLLEVIHMIAQPGEAMRLDHGNDAPRPDALARSGEHGADFDRVVAVIVDDRHDTLTRRDLADLGEAALDARETVEARGDLVVGKDRKSTRLNSSH